MSLRSTVALVVGAAAIVAGAVSIGAAEKPTLTSGNAVQKQFPAIAPAAPRAPEAQEPLFRGDMLPNLGLGCSTPSGASGGPNDWATRVTATLVPTFGVVSTTYNIFTFNSGPTWNLMAWNNTPTVPGTVIATCPLGQANGTTGNHTVAVPAGCVTITPANGQTFFFGLSNVPDTLGIRIGMDNNGSTPNSVYLRAPGCGLNAFGTVESIGFPGFWVHRIIIDDTVPVELMDYNIS